MPPLRSLLLIELVEGSEYPSNLFGLEFKLSELCLEDHESAIQVVDALAKLTELEADQGVGHVCLCRQKVVGPEFCFEKLPDHLQVLEGFLIIVLIDDGLLGVLHVLEVFVNDKLLPDSGYLIKETPCFLDGILLLEELAHVVITAA